MQKYGIVEFIYNCYSYLFTKVFFNQSRFIRQPSYIRGASSIVGAKGLTIGYNCRFDLPGNFKTLYIGDNCEFGDNTHIVALRNVEIGNNVLIASRVFISDTSHGNYKGKQCDSPASKPNERKLISDSVIIGDNVWIGENCVILSGVHIGQGTIIGANSVVTRNIGPGVIAIGIPARPIKVYKDGEWVKIHE